MKILFTFITLLLTASSALSQNDKLASNSNIYEEEKEEKKITKFTAKVRTASEDSGGWIVFFEGNKQPGVYSLSSKLSEFGSYTNLVEESRKNNGPELSITADKEKNIESITKAEKRPQPNFDPNKKWNFGP